MDEIKKVVLPNADKKSKEAGKRKIVTTEQWENNIDIINTTNPMDLLKQVAKKNNNSLSILIEKGIQTKIHGYKNQDMKKKIYNENLFVDYKYVLDLIERSSLECYYCKNISKLLYENVKDQNQWTLDRLNNKQGHNKDNVVISCLSCNLKRKTMHHGRYQFTKQLKIIKNETVESDLK